MRLSQAGPVDTSNSPHARLKTLPLANISLLDGFWAQKQKVNRESSINCGYKMLKDVGTYTNFLLARGESVEGGWKGHRSRDSDLYKWLEAVSYELAAHPESDLKQAADEAIELIASAQVDDGYLNTYFQYVEPERRWKDLGMGHELYAAGHLIQAAVAHRRATGKDDLLDVARRFADNIDSIFGPGKRDGTAGHPEIEMALVELYRTTGEKRCLDLANFFIDRRGHKTLTSRLFASWYYPDHVPVREASKIEGHAVRALYLAAGLTDAYMETGEKALLEALERQWHDMATRKMYVTGGLGASHRGESFGKRYELPNDTAYAETCAAIAGIMWSWRMLLATGEGRFANVIERTLYNGFLSGVSLDGTKYFYQNPLRSVGNNERVEWFGCACCPPNVMRLLSSIQHYVATSDDNGIQIHQYATSRIEADIEGRRVALAINTNYPWEELVSIIIEETGASAWELAFRIPAWSDKCSLRVNGKAEQFEIRKGYAVISRTWKKGDTVELDVPMTPRFTLAHPAIDSNRGKVAIERGPIVYCLEQCDHDSSLNILDVEIDTSAPLETKWRDDILGGVMTIKAQGTSVDFGPWEGELYRNLTAPVELNRQPVQLTAIPYYAWANRAKGPMRVWIPKART